MLFLIWLAVYLRYVCIIGVSLVSTAGLLQLPRISRPVQVRHGMLTSPAGDTSQRDHNPKPRFESTGVSTDFVASSPSSIRVSDSIISVLIKMHCKLSGKPCSYRTPSERKLDQSRIGDGPHFIEQLLDKIYLLSEKCARQIKNICESMQPRGHGTKMDTSSSFDKEER